jgi:hypothetical protein
MYTICLYFSRAFLKSQIFALRVIAVLLLVAYLVARAGNTVDSTVKYDAITHLGDFYEFP